MSPDHDARLRLRVAVKLLVLVAGAAVIAVAFGFVFGGPDRSPPALVRVVLDGIAPGETRTVGWNSRPVTILHRTPDTVARLRGEGAAGHAPAWLVVHARGTGEGCPVVWEPERTQFRESCGTARYDAAGRPTESGYPPLEQPPHRIENGVLILGRDPRTTDERG